MFQLTGGEGPVPAYSGYGLGGLKGLKSLPERICNLVICCAQECSCKLIFLLSIVQRQEA